MCYSTQSTKRNTDKWGFIKTEDFCKRLLGRQIDKLYINVATAAHSTELEHTAKRALKTQHKKPS